MRFEIILTLEQHFLNCASTRRAPPVDIIASVYDQKIACNAYDTRGSLRPS